MIVTVENPFRQRPDFQIEQLPLLSRKIVENRHGNRLLRFTRREVEQLRLRDEVLIGRGHRKVRFRLDDILSRHTDVAITPHRDRQCRIGFHHRRSPRIQLRRALMITVSDVIGRGRDRANQRGVAGRRVEQVQPRRAVTVSAAYSFPV